MITFQMHLELSSSFSAILFLYGVLGFQSQPTKKLNNESIKNEEFFAYKIIQNVRYIVAQNPFKNVNRHTFYNMISRQVVKYAHFLNTITKSL